MPMPQLSLAEGLRENFSFARSFLFKNKVQHLHKVSLFWIRSIENFTGHQKGLFIDD